MTSPPVLDAVVDPALIVIGRNADGARAFVTDGAGEGLDVRTGVPSEIATGMAWDDLVVAAETRQAGKGEPA